MNNRLRHRWCTARVVVLAMLLALQSLVATLPALGAPAEQAHVLVTGGGTSEPCEHGHGDCCEQGAPASTPCDERDACAGGDCALRTLASLPAVAFDSLAPAAPAGRLPADAPRWLLMRHDAPPLPPPISA